MLTRYKINKIFATLQSQDPEPKTELVYSNNFELLIAVMWSAQATDVSVNKATKPLYAKYNTPEQFLALGEDGLRDAIKSIGLYRTKASNAIKTCRILIEQYNSEVPDTREALESLPGVGRKTANVILNVAFGQPTMAVDTHIFRVGNRLGLAPGKTPLEVEKGLLAVIPKAYQQHAHHWLILLGRYTCLARKPKCEICALSSWCDYYQTNVKKAK
jgi:endonuclease-3